MVRNRLLVALLCAFVLAACSNRYDPSSEAGYGTAAPAPTPAPAPAPEPAGAVTADETALGQALTDVDGRVLYAFTKDTDGTSSCYGDCAATWPALTVEGPVTAGDGVEVDWLATAERDDGSTQVTYKGMPLYHYAGDTQPGDVNGQGIGGVWFAVTPDGRLIRATAGGSDDGSDGGSYGDSYP
jgi:predicted lipoprotein with Yx(FWY)xxD motif